MKKQIMATAFRKGQRFKFPGGDDIYIFVSTHYVGDVPVIVYLDSDDAEHTVEGYDLFDLTHA